MQSSVRNMQCNLIRDFKISSLDLHLTLQTSIFRRRWKLEDVVVLLYVKTTRRRGPTNESAWMSGEGTIHILGSKTSSAYDLIKIDFNQVRSYHLTLKSQFSLVTLLSVTSENWEKQKNVKTFNIKKCAKNALTCRILVTLTLNIPH